MQIHLFVYRFLLESKINRFSNIIGEKIRESEKEYSEDPDFIAIKEKLESTGDEKSKKQLSKKQKSNLWYDLEYVKIYNGLGIKGELEIYFKGIEEMKLQKENLLKIKNSVDIIIEKGLKGDLGCITYQKTDGPIEIAFLKSDSKRERFSFRTSYTVTPKVTVR